jgi:gluconolactonase
MGAGRSASARRTAAGVRGGSIQRVDLRTGEFATLYDACDGKPLNSPNDLVFDSTGGFWLSTLGYFDGENRRLGAVYYAQPDGSRIVRWRSGADGLVSPNGVGLSPKLPIEHALRRGLQFASGGATQM